MTTEPRSWQVITNKIPEGHHVKCFREMLRMNRMQMPGVGLILRNTYNQTLNRNHMKLGAFSMSLNVKDINASKQFYESLGFTVFAGALERKYLIMKNENALIGLFQGMFQGNILTFNPGWDEHAQNIESFDDVREIQRDLKRQGLELVSEADEQTSGPASLMITDPDGNVVLIDQHR